MENQMNIKEPNPQIAILQLSKEDNADRLRFRDFEFANKVNGYPNSKNYEILWCGNIDEKHLDSVFEKFNGYNNLIEKEKRYYGYSLSVGDIVAVKNENSAYNFHFVEDFGYIHLDNKLFESTQIEANIKQGLTVVKELEVLEYKKNINIPLSPDEELRLCLLEKGYKHAITFVDQKVEEYLQEEKNKEIVNNFCNETKFTNKKSNNPVKCH